MTVLIDEYKIAYCPLPGAGSNAVKTFLAVVDPLHVAQSVEDVTDTELDHNYSTVPFEAEILARLSGWFKFCVIRDPVARLIDIYENRLAGRDLLLACDVVSTELPSQPDSDTFFSNLSVYRMHSIMVARLVRPAIRYLGPDLGLFEAVYPVEEIYRIGHDIGRRAGRSVVLPRRERRLCHTKVQDLSREAQLEIYEFTREDYRLMKDFYQPAVRSLALRHRDAYPQSQAKVGGRDHDAQASQGCGRVPGNSRAARAQTA
ncbi:sulfotransferase family 2 domain-containing protein [Candidatus Halocynthiibacter alkanivorans]|uniref:sulfotransferase family 2 domain-containing protein n=1 Tax=Candidatus Halocynthiibacter alkanivorans TaxID=2267619 RepID=UPI000DF138C4|nr:sulfotransferase family 2 domain-containing protein [Candidatus Halocynthiibacter alkanivorans]